MNTPSEVCGVKSLRLGSRRRSRPEEGEAMTQTISPEEFLEAQGVEDWRVVSDGACAFFPTDSFAASARFVEAIGDELDAASDPDIDIRSGGVTVRLITIADDHYGMAVPDVDRARRISAVARKLDLAADPSAV